MSEDKRNDAQSKKGAGKNTGGAPASKPSTAGSADSTAPSSQGASGVQKKKSSAAASQSANASGAKPSADHKTGARDSSAAGSTPAGAAAASAGSKPSPGGAGTTGSRTSGASPAQVGSASSGRGPGNSPSSTAERVGAASRNTPPPASGRGNGGSGKSGSPALLVSIIALIVAIVSIIGSGWLWYRGQQKLASLDSRTNTVEKAIQSSVQQVVTPKLNQFDDRLQSFTERLSGFDQRIKSVSDDMSSAKDAQAEKLASLKQSLTNVQSQTSRMADQIAGNANRWDLDQIESLLRSANQRLQLFDDPQGARQALEFANDAISRKGDPRLFKIRSEIVKEIAALKALPSPDVEGLSLTLASLIEQVPGLPLASSVPSEYKQNGQGGQSKSGGSAANGDGNSHSASADNGSQNAADSHTGALSWANIKTQVGARWQNFSQSVGKALSGMFTIRRDDGTQSALLPPGQVYFLNQNLQLELRTARLALLEQDTDAYKSSLASANKWLGDYYDTSESSVSSMRDQLDKMSNVKLDAQAPDISKSLSMLRDAMARQTGTSGSDGESANDEGSGSDDAENAGGTNNANGSNGGNKASGSGSASAADGADSAGSPKDSGGTNSTNGSSANADPSSDTQSGNNAGQEGQ